VLVVASLVLVSGVSVAAVVALAVARDQSRVAQFIEAVVALSGGVSSFAGWLLPRVWRQGVEPTGGVVAGLPVAVPVGPLPPVVRGRAELMGRLHRLLRSPGEGPAVLAGLGGGGQVDSCSGIR
jgi:hypothetical protein